MIEAALAEETIGTSFVLNFPSKYLGKSSGKPAPANIMSIPSSIDVFTKSKVKLLEWVARRRKIIKVYLNSANQK